MDLYGAYAVLVTIGSIVGPPLIYFWPPMRGFKFWRERMYLQVKKEVEVCFPEFIEGTRLPDGISLRPAFILAWRDGDGREVMLEMRNDYSFLCITSISRRIDCIDAILNREYLHPFVASWKLDSFKSGSVLEIIRQVIEQLKLALRGDTEHVALPVGAQVVEVSGHPVVHSQGLARMEQPG